MKLTKAQIRFLSRCKEYEEEAALPLPTRRADMRSHGSLLDRGLIAFVWAGDEGYILTPAGRRALSNGETG